MDSPWGCKESDTTEQLSLHFTSLLMLWELFIESNKKYFSHAENSLKHRPDSETECKE